MNSTGERTESALTGAEEIRLIHFLEKEGWTAEKIIDLLKYIKR